MADGEKPQTSWVQFEEGAGGMTDIRLDEIRSDGSAIIADPAKLLQASGRLASSSTKEGVAEISVSAHEEASGASGGLGSSVSPPLDPHVASDSSTERGVFKNGKIICAVYPENTSMAWIVPARFNPYSMPKTLADDRLSLPAEDYVTAMEMITNDYRFRCFCIFYGRLLAFWISLSIIVLVLVLLSQPNGGIAVLIFTLVWMLAFFGGIVGVLVIRKQILIGLRHCVQSANKFLVGSDILAGVDDRGVLSCHKVVIMFMYIRAAECVPDVERLIRQYNAMLQPAPKQMSHKEIEERAEFLILKYSNNFVKDTSKKKLVFPTRPLEGISEFTPKHCPASYCLCQYIEKKHFNRPPRAWYDHIV